MSFDDRDLAAYDPETDRRPRRSYAMWGLPLALAWIGLIGAWSPWDEDAPLWFVAVGCLLFLGPLLLTEAVWAVQDHGDARWRDGRAVGYAEALGVAPQEDPRVVGAADFEWPDPRDFVTLGEDLARIHDAVRAARVHAPIDLYDRSRDGRA